MESETPDVCSWCKRKLEPVASTEQTSTRPDLHFLAEGEAEGGSHYREIIAGLVIAVAVMGCALFFLLRNSSQPPSVPSETLLTAERSAPPQPPIVYTNADVLGAPRTTPLPSGAPNPEAEAARHDEYEQAPVYMRADGQTPTAQASKRVADSIGENVNARLTGPQAYVESADILVARVENDATVTAKVVLVNLAKRPIIKYALTLELGNLRTQLHLTEQHKGRTTLQGTASMEVALTAKTLVSDEDLKARKRVLLDAWYEEKAPSVKDALVIGLAKAKKSG